MDVIAGPGAAFVNYTTTVVLVTKGRTLLFRNFDLANHNVKSPKGLFSTSTLIGFNRTARVNGVEQLKKGTYKFFCEPHRFVMKGQLIVG